ncbi:MAG: HAD family hydrolase [Candidatus Bathyarchaeia archaeon]
MAETKAVLLDYIGTLTNARGYNLDASRVKLHRALVEAGFVTSREAFLSAYCAAHEKYRIVRYEQLREVTNAVWVAEALGRLGYEASSDDPRVKAALNIFFRDYIDTLELRPYAKRLLGKIAANCKLGLVSNFTYAPVIYASLRELGINRFFNAIVVSEEVGWRKPHEYIFQVALRRLQVKAAEAVYIGDSPVEDMEGAKAVGMKTVFVPSQFYSLRDLKEIKRQPDVVVEGLHEIFKSFNTIIALEH